MPLKYEDLRRAKEKLDDFLPGKGGVGQYLMPVPYALGEAAPMARGDLLRSLRDFTNKRLAPLGTSLPVPAGPTLVQRQQMAYRSRAKGSRDWWARARRDLAQEEDKYLAQPGVVPGYTEPDFSQTIQKSSPLKYKNLPGMVPDPQAARQQWKDFGRRSTDSWTRPGGTSAYTNPRRSLGKDEMDWRRQGLARQSGFPDSTGRVWPPEEEALNPYRGKGINLVEHRPETYAPRGQGGYVTPARATYAGWPSVRDMNVGYISDEDWMAQRGIPGYPRSQPTRDELKWGRRAVREMGPSTLGNRKSMMDNYRSQRGQRGGNLTLPQKLSFPTR